MTSPRVKNGWVETTLKELVDIFDSKRIPLSTGERVKRKGSFPYYGASNIVDYIDDFIFDGDYLLISEDGENLNTRNTPIAFMASGKFWVNNHAHIVRGKEKHMTKYLYWYFSQLDISPYITGAVQPKLSKSNLESIQIKIPENPDEQRAIAAVLSSLDDKIELLREQNKTLEAMAQQLFREWFTEFNFPDADGKPYKKSGGRMIDSELGEIPEGWRVGRIGDVVEIRGGSTPSTQNTDFWDGEIAWTSPKDLSNSQEIFLLKTEKKITEKGLTQISSGLLPKGTLLLSSRAPIGYLALSALEVAINQGYIAFLPNQKFSNNFMYLWLKMNMQKIINASNGSTFLEISKSSFRGIDCVIPKSLFRI